MCIFVYSYKTNLKEAFKIAGHGKKTKGVR